MYTRGEDWSAIRRQARVAGLLYLTLALIAPIGLLYVPGKLMVIGNAAATADNIRASEGLLRIGIASELIHQTIGIFLVLALYRLFKPVNETHAKQLVILGALVSVPIVFVNVRSRRLRCRSKRRNCRSSSGSRFGASRENPFTRRRVRACRWGIERE